MNPELAFASARNALLLILREELDGSTRHAALQHIERMDQAMDISRNVHDRLERMTKRQLRRPGLVRRVVVAAFS